LEQAILDAFSNCGFVSLSNVLTALVTGVGEFVIRSETNQLINSLRRINNSRFNRWGNYTAGMRLRTQETHSFNYTAAIQVQ